MRELDAIDRRIIQTLRINGRTTNVQLAAAVGLSASACLRRLRLLEARGVIRGYTAIIEDPTEVTPTTVIIEIALERQTEEYFRKFELAVRRCPEIHQCYLMTGASDYLLLVQARSTSDYERIHNEVLSRLPGVARLHSSLAIRKVRLR